jgi:hypothetical protein
VHTIVRKLYGKVWIVSALSMKRESRFLESQIFVVFIGEVDEGGVGMSLSLALANALDKFTYWMHDYFSKVHPPRCMFYHCIDLELRLQHPTRAPY